jgi:hypothetical protein
MDYEQLANMAKRDRKGGRGKFMGSCADQYGWYFDFEFVIIV